MSIKNILISLLVWFCFCPTNLFSQVEWQKTNAQSATQSKLDSLWVIYKNATNIDTIRFKALNEIFKHFRNTKPDSAFVLIEELLVLARKVNRAEYEGNALLSLGILYEQQSDYPKALEYLLSALQLFEKVKHKVGIYACLANIGFVYENQKQFDKSMLYRQRALKISREIGEPKIIGKAYNNLGSEYFNVGQHKKALENFLLALSYAEKHGDKREEIISLNNIANCYTALSDYKTAKEYYLRSLHERKKIGEMSMLGMAYFNLGEMYLRMNNLGLSKAYFDSAQFVSESYNKRELLSAIYENMSNVCIKSKDYKGAYEYFVKYKSIQDSIYNRENSIRLGEVKTKYEVEKRETELKLKSEKQEAIAKEKLQQERMQRNYFLGGFVLVFIVAAIIFRSYRQKSKANSIILEQKNEIESKHKEITDSINYAERIQRSLLASSEVLDSYFDYYFIVFEPKDVVSGDFYWVSQLTEGKLMLVVGDSTGHGVPGAIMSIVNITSLEKSVEYQGICEPALVLDETRSKIINILKRDGSSEGGRDGMDCSLAVFDFKNRNLIFASANNPIWIVREKKVIELLPDKMPLGKGEKDMIPFNQHFFSFLPGDSVYMFTDGIADQFGGPQGKKFKYKQLKEMIVEVNNLPMKEQKRVISARLNAWRGNLEQVDDITILGLRC
ncbi:MAG: tetratricopeptide repeat protein [Bacteroidia bacterium]|nr:tetratricopeptide repeat protein [Bacteroidia bacterium]